MPTLTQIRINKKNNEKYRINRQLNYKNPHSINLISTLMKSQNITFIEEICNDNNVCSKQKQDILNALIKPNYYSPYIINSQLKEKLQKII